MATPWTFGSTPTRAHTRPASNPARLIDWSDRISKTHIREVENFTTPEEAAKRMTEIIEAAAEHAAQIQRPESVTERHHLTVPRLADLAALPTVHA